MKVNVNMDMEEMKGTIWTKGFCVVEILAKSERMYSIVNTSTLLIQIHSF
jgi:hypothetical protein